MDRYAVMGNPIGHSLSPFIHKVFASDTEQALFYEALEVALDGFPVAVKQFFAEGGKGLNVTVPFKQEAWSLAEHHSPEAELAGAVNTLYQDRNGRLVGHNTDGIGLVRDILTNHSGEIKGKSVLVLGAGGATRGILLPLLQEAPLTLCIANRTRSKADKLVSLYADYGRVSACDIGALKEQKVDWVINASSASLHGELPPLDAGMLNPGAACYDLMYAKHADEETVFCQWARQAGASKVMDGIGMLVEQAAESFALWRGIRPQTDGVLEQLKEGG